MRKCKTKVLSFILTLALAAGCFSGMGNTVKAAGNDLKIKVVDENGETVPGLTFEVKDANQQRVGDTMTTDADGMLQCKIGESYNGNYELMLLAGNLSYEAKTWLDFYCSSGTVSYINIDGKRWDGNGDLTFTVKKASTKKAITIKLVDGNNRPITDKSVYLQVTDTENLKYNDPNAVQTVIPQNGEYTFNVNDTGAWNTEILIELHPEVTGYTANPIRLKVDTNSEIVEVDGVSGYDTSIPKEMVVSKQGGSEPVKEVTIKSIGKISAAVPAEGKQLEVTVNGDNLTADNWGIKVEKYKKGTTEPAGRRAGNSSAAVVTAASKAIVTIDANTLKDDIDVKLIAGPRKGDIIEEQAAMTITQSGNKKAVLTIKLVNQKNRPVTDPGLSLSFYQEGYEGYGPGFEGTLERSKNGEFIFEAGDNEKGQYKIKLDKNDLGYSMDEVTVNIKTYYIIDKVDGAAYKGDIKKVTVINPNIPMTDKEALAALIKEAESKAANDYKADSNWAAMQSALSVAKKVYDNDMASQEEVTKAEENLARTLKAIVKKSSVNSTKPQPSKPVVKVRSIKLSAVSKKLAAGKKMCLSAAVSPKNASNKAIVYKSSSKKYAVVDKKGVVTAKKAGAGKTVTITATAADGSGKKAVYRITIMKDAVKSIKVKAAKSVQAGKKVKAKATVKTTGKKANKQLEWTSSNTKYATVSSKGVVSAKKAGKGKTVKITAAATDGSNKKATVKIRIK